MNRLSQQVALITGGGSGIGKAIARRLVAESALVVISDIRLDVGGEAAAELDCMFLEQDVCKEESWCDVVGRIERQFGRLTILVNNAGMAGKVDASIEESRLEDWRRLFSVNVESVYLGCRAAIPAMGRAGGGSIVNISSIAAMLATPAFLSYGASKAAVSHITASLAQYCAERRLNIRCNSVHPGNVLTPLWMQYAQDAASSTGVPADDIVAEAKARNPLGGFTRPEDVAATVAFLVSDDARHVTGERFVVDGGYLSCNSYDWRAVKAQATKAGVRLVR